MTILRSTLIAERLRELADHAREVAALMSGEDHPGHVNHARARLIEDEATRYDKWADLIEQGAA